MEQGGLGFHLFATAIDGAAMTAVEGTASFEALNVKKTDTTSKFVLYLEVPRFISNFYRKIETAKVQDVYPDSF